MRALLSFAAPWIAFVAIGTAYAGDQTIFYDFKPKACPNWFTPPSTRMPLDPIPTAILGTGELDATNVRTNSLVLIVPGGGGVLGEGGNVVYPVDVFLKDASRPVPDPTDCKCTDEGPDEFLDLMARFDPKELADALGPVSDNDVIPVCIQAELLDGTILHGCDCIVIKLGPVAVESDTWGRTKATYR